MSTSSDLEVARSMGLPLDAVLDDRLEQNLAKRGIWWAVLADGTRVAWGGRSNMEEEYEPCVVCAGDRDKMPDCAHCQGTGSLIHVPFCARPWDQVIPGLWLGGHDCQPGDHDPAIYGESARTGEVVVGSQFDLVVSLHSEPGAGPSEGVVHVRHRMADAELDPEHHNRLDALADMVKHAVESGQNVLVRCHAGMNRSALVAGLAMIQMGWTVDDILKRMRAARSPYVLFNQSFVNHLRAVEARSRPTD